VFKQKPEQDKSFRYKGRIVVKGYVQIPNHLLLLLLLLLCGAFFSITRYNWHQHVKDQWICEIIDVEDAFLEGDMDESIYIEWPDGILDYGFESVDTIKITYILLEKAMNGTVQAALQFFKKLVENVTLIGLEQSKVDPCVFFMKKQGKMILIICPNVDDCAIAGKLSNVQWFISLIKKYFTIKGLGILHTHLGVRVG
jgi:hypothetical protein